MSARAIRSYRSPGHQCEGGSIPTRCPYFGLVATSQDSLAAVRAPRFGARVHHVHSAQGAAAAPKAAAFAQALWQRLSHERLRHSLHRGMLRSFTLAQCFDRHGISGRGAWKLSPKTRSAAARNRSGAISPRSNVLTKTPSGRRANRASRLVLRKCDVPVPREYGSVTGQSARSCLPRVRIAAQLHSRSLLLQKASASHVT